MQESILVKNILKPIEKYLKIKSLIEICINKPCEVWLETFEGWTKKTDNSLNLYTLEQLGYDLASMSGQEWGEEYPFLATHIPNYGYRVQMVFNTVLDSQKSISISIRAGNTRIIKLSKYFPKDKNTGLNPKKEILEKFMLEGKTILVSGGTSSGKTTFLNSIIPYIPENKRVITIEDTKEINLNHKNNVRFVKSKSGTDKAKVSYEDIINACMRLRPDRLIMGELDIKNTAAFLRLINTGHSGAMATIHANSHVDALIAITQNLRLSGFNTQGKIDDYTLSAIDGVVQMKRDDKRNIFAELKLIEEIKQEISKTS